jgi:beta-1,4-mannooligosaccharide/beta-1,4-mannosyl-N-acetylglucosamine phosphorylase
MNYTPLPNIPWEEQPAGISDVVWRYSANPIIPRDLIPSANSIFNSAVVPFQGKFAGVFRCDNRKREMNLNRGFSENGIDWELENDPIEWQSDDPEISSFQYRYDPRVVWIEDRYYVTWCNGGATGIEIIDNIETIDTLTPTSRHNRNYRHRYKGQTLYSKTLNR